MRKIFFVLFLTSAYYPLIAQDNALSIGGKVTTDNRLRTEGY